MDLEGGGLCMYSFQAHNKHFMPSHAMMQKFTPTPISTRQNVTIFNQSADSNPNNQVHPHDISPLDPETPSWTKPTKVIHIDRICVECRCCDDARASTSMKSTATVPRWWRVITTFRRGLVDKAEYCDGGSGVLEGGICLGRIEPFRCGPSSVEKRGLVQGGACHYKSQSVQHRRGKFNKGDRTKPREWATASDAV